jgi:hypothetical protein
MELFSHLNSFSHSMRFANDGEIKCVGGNCIREREENFEG